MGDDGGAEVRSHREWSTTLLEPATDPEPPDQVDEAKHKLKDTEAKLEQYGRETGKEIAQKIDETDRKVEATAAKAKSSLSSWFSSGNK